MWKITNTNEHKGDRSPWEGKKGGMSGNNRFYCFHMSLIKPSTFYPWSLKVLPTLTLTIKGEEIHDVLWEACGLMQLLGVWAIILVIEASYSIIIIKYVTHLYVYHPCNFQQSTTTNLIFVSDQRDWAIKESAIHFMFLLKFPRAKPRSTTQIIP